jgi:hypothetical protein
MERKRINSSKIRAVGYDPKSQLLEVEFSDGKLIHYRGVSPEVHRQSWRRRRRRAFSRTRSTKVFHRAG